MAAEGCPVVDGEWIPLQLFADDLTHLGLTYRRLICPLVERREWCQAFRMSVNIRKCKVLIAHPNADIRDFVRNACPVGTQPYQL